ncbi:MAG: hypothetical protein K0U41_10390 [Gammaproteobacteria bacterium]|nr:hypothetical protein [Gammaproteobacteria bacterium]
MIEKYGKKGEVWSNYLKRCLEHGTFTIPPSLNVTKKRARAIRLLVEDELDDEAVPNGTSNDSSLLKDGDSTRQTFPSQGEFFNLNQQLIVMCCLRIIFKCRQC